MDNRDDPSSLSERRFGEFADHYVHSPSHAQGNDLTRLVELANPQPHWEVLDVATGGGHTALAFAPYVRHVVASDLTARMLQAAAEYIKSRNAPNISFRQAMADDLPFQSDHFHAVTCRIAAHHFPDAAKFVRESARVLRAGGVLLVQDHVLPDDRQAAQEVDSFEKLRDPSHNRAFTKEAWRGLFVAAGLVVEHTQVMTKRHTFLEWAGRQGCSPETIAELRLRMAGFSETARAWLVPQNWESGDASFANRHILIVGRKAAP
ncbi:MAG: class I SAM-dependent methyltransferase [Chloroflexi bacterium]|nr:class I SAM-dependent methyltransferase [Chloroflexota bacterium]